MQFLYYRPGHNRAVSHDDVKRWGLGYAFDKQPVSSECMNRTPDGNGGRVFIGAMRDGEIPQMNLDKQTWQKMPGDRMGAPVYIGYWNDHHPTVDDLKRDDILAGYSYELLDGMKWEVPVARCYGDAGHVSNLPRAVGINDAGEAILGDVVAKHNHLWALTAPIVEDLLAVYGLGPEPEVRLTEQQIIDTAVAILQVNYRVSLTELAALKVLQAGKSAGVICSLACDWPELDLRLRAAADEEAKKNATAEAIVTTTAGVVD